ncbi:sigma 54-interacting transcriptional regulator [Acuticoccus kandeliae]|uniref:sigma 54-interacting transcriptional regulator n=1 Tax=Acuticoccus kandeliae TaxID=2073160 RepID=UPI000D3E366C|nr:sigma 54-interacting transcriptional regulator [Acuticoccus kandeliae]
MFEVRADRARHPALDAVEDLFEQSEAGILAIDPTNDRIVSANATVAAMLGQTGTPIRGRRASEVFRVCLPDFINLTEECIVRGSAWNPALTLSDAAGNTIEIEVFASIAERTERTYLGLLIFDARRQRRRHAKRDFDRLYRLGPVRDARFDTIFREIERGNRLILDAAGDGIYGVNARGETTFVNPAAERMLGWKADELIGSIAHAVMHHSHEDGGAYDVHECPIYAAFRDGTVHRVEGEVFWRRNGTSFPVDYTSTPIYDDGRLIGAVVVFRDVSERLVQERRLTSALAEVERLRHRLEAENAYLTDEIGAHHNHHELVGASHAILRLAHQIDAVAPTEAPVLITGETGSGRELVARAIHNASARRQRPFVRVNCAAFPGDALESELFGHAAGINGTAHARIGRYELADEGTLFLQDVAAMSVEHQLRLVRALEDGRFERVGDDRPIAARVRVIASTDRDLADLLAEGRFCEDLYWRLNVFPIEVPPLRARREDIRALAQHFMERAASQLGRPTPRLSLANLQALEDYDWPGNVRELENVIERAVIVSQNNKLSFEAIAEHAPDERAAKTLSRVPTEQELREIEHEAITTALARCRGRVSGPNGAGAMLGIKPTTLYSRLKRLGIDASAFK